MKLISTVLATAFLLTITSDSHARDRDAYNNEVRNNSLPKYGQWPPLVPRQDPYYPQCTDYPVFDQFGQYISTSVNCNP